MQPILPAGVLLRPAVAAELDVLWALRTRALLAGCSAHYPPEVIAVWSTAPLAPSLARLVAAGSALVVEEGGVVLGFAALNAETGELDAAFVEPAQQGRGLALVLLDALEALARRRGIARLFLSSSLNAAPFYRRAGFVALREEVYPHFSGVGIASVFMEKPL